MSEEAKKLADAHGGIWKNHPDYSAADWVYEVTNGDTRLGYWDWVLARIEVRK